MDLPEPWVCHTTPALPLLRTASIVEPTALDTAKYWCGFSKATVTATSPITGENYEMDCIVNPTGKGTTCTGADGAIVDISLTEQSHGPLVTGERPGPLYLNY